jgi:hypothetical protein
MRVHDRQGDDPAVAIGLAKDNPPIYNYNKEVGLSALSERITYMGE